MKQFFDNLKANLARWMQGRYGADDLSRFILLCSIVLLVLSWILPIGLIYYISLAGYVWALFRMLSRNINKRAQENATYLEKTAHIRTEISQARVRFKNRKQYKYFKCPKCGVRLRLTRGVGEKHITCRRCGHEFNIKA